MDAPLDHSGCLKAVNVRVSASQYEVSHHLTLKWKLTYCRRMPTPWRRPLPPNFTNRAQQRHSCRSHDFSTIVGPPSEQRGGVQLLSSSALHTSGSSTSSRRMGSMHQHQLWPLTLALPAWVPSPTASDDIAKSPKYSRSSCPMPKGSKPPRRTVGRKRPVLTKNTVMERTGARLFFLVLSSKNGEHGVPGTAWAHVDLQTGDQQEKQPLVEGGDWEPGSRVD